ncbi:MAG: glycoside hydrolase family 95 protein [Terrimicrobiaceae bacterium]
MKTNSRQRLWYQEPAGQNWNRALPIGCGKLGAMVFGNIVSERIQLNEDSLWSGGPRDRNNPDTLKSLPAIRELLLTGQLKAAESLINDAMAGIPDSMRHYEPLADVLIEFEHPGVERVRTADEQAEAASNSVPGFDSKLLSAYHRELDLDSATALVTYTLNGNSFQREHIASAVENAIVFRYTALTPGTLSFRLRMERGPRDSYSSRFADTSQRTGQNGILLKGASAGEEGVRFAACLRCEAEGGDFRITGETLHVERADRVTLVLAAATSFREADPAAYTLQRSGAALDIGWDRLLAEHIADHQKLFRRVDLQLGSEADAELTELLPTDQRLLQLQAGKPDPGLAALYFQYGRYLLISASRPGSLPSNLQGLWNQDFQPAWGSKYTININLQMNYWPAEAANLPECHEPLFDLIHRMAETGRRTARVMYGCRGFVAHHNTDIWADTAPTDRNLAASYWLMGGAWLPLHLWEHYAYSGDLDFLRKSYPVLRESCRFFLDFLVENSNGQLIVLPSASPENVYRLPNGETSAISAGCAMDSMILNRLFRCTKEAAAILACDSDLCDELEAALEKLLQPSIGKNGLLMEWLEDYEETDPLHRHVSHGFGAFPGDQISVRKTPELAEAFRATLRSRGDDGTGWCMAWKSCFWARMGDGNKAHHLLQQLLRPVGTALEGGKSISFHEGGSYPNLFCAHPPFQIDGNFGGTAAILEMLLQSHETENGLPTIHILPALPDVWPDGMVAGLCSRGGFQLSFSWRRGKLADLEISSSRGGSCQIFYQGLSTNLDLSPGMKRNLELPTGSPISW